MAVTDSVKTGGNDSVSDPQMTKTLIAMTSQEQRFFSCFNKDASESAKVFFDTIRGRLLSVGACFMK